MDYFLFALFVIVCVLLIIVVLLQKGRGGGLGAAFGGMGTSAFGTRIGDVFTWVTIVLTGLFLLLAIGTTMWFRPAPEQVVRPIFTPAPGDYGEPQSVMIESLTPGAKINYTLDGSDPNEGSTLYESPVRVEPGVTLKARAFRPDGWIPSGLRQGYYGPVEEPMAPASEPANQPTEVPASAPASQSEAETAAAPST